MLLSRLRGSLVAAVVGDCIGALYESSGVVTMEEVLGAVKKREQKWADNKKKVADGKTPKTVPQLCFTDDTAMARSIAASIIQNRTVNVEDIAARFAKEFEKEPGRGYGGNVITVLRALADPNLKDLFQPAREQFGGSGSYGNGGGMRISPLGLFYYQKLLSDLKEKTVNITQLTHTHPLAIVGAILQSFAVQLALSLDNSQPLDTSAFLDELLDRLRPVEKEIYDHHKQMKKEENQEEEKSGDKSEDKTALPYCDKLELMKEFLRRQVDKDEVEMKLGNDISALKSVPTAVYCFLKGADKSIPGLEERSAVEQTILYAISLGGDTDTIATMAAAIAGAFYGLEAVPQAWQDSCEGVEDALMFGEKMAELISPGDAP